MIHHIRQTDSVKHEFELNVPFFNHSINIEYNKKSEIEKDKLNKIAGKTTTINFILNHIFIHIFLSFINGKNSFGIELDQTKGVSFFSFFRFKVHFSNIQIYQTQIKIPIAFIFILRQNLFNWSNFIDFGYYRDKFRVSFEIRVSNYPGLSVGFEIRKRNLLIFFISFSMTILTYILLRQIIP